MLENTVVRRAISLSIEIAQGGNLVCKNFIAQTETPLSMLGLEILRALDVWNTVDRLCSILCGRFERNALLSELVTLISVDLVVVQNSEAAIKDEQYEVCWLWDSSVAHYHFRVRNPDYPTVDEAVKVVASRAAEKMEIPLVSSHGLCEDVIALDDKGVDDAFADLLKKRRSSRSFADQSMTLEALTYCLSAGFRITHFGVNPLPGAAPLPLSNAPSAGARNPFEAFLYCRDVSGLSKGAYHYSAMEHSLARLHFVDDLPEISSLLGNQEWFDSASVVVFFLANFSRTAWKYSHPTGYRVVLYEAGHIAQNILLAATSQNLAATPTSAISDEAAESVFGINNIMNSFIYAVGIGVEGGQPSVADFSEIVANPFSRKT